MNRHDIAVGDGKGCTGHFPHPDHRRPSETTFYTISVGLASGCTSEMGSVTGGGSYEAGSSAVIKATPNVGYVFSKWDDDNTSAARTLTITEDLTLSASFESAE